MVPSQKISFDPKVSERSPSRASTDIETVIYIYAVSLEHPASWGLSVSFAPLEKPLRGDKLCPVSSTPPTFSASRIFFADITPIFRLPLRGRQTMFSELFGNKNNNPTR